MNVGFANHGAIEPGMGGDTEWTRSSSGGAEGTREARMTRPIGSLLLLGASGDLSGRLLLPAIGQLLDREESRGRPDLEIPIILYKGSTGLGSSLRGGDPCFWSRF